VPSHYHYLEPAKRERGEKREKILCPFLAFEMIGAEKERNPHGLLSCKGEGHLSRKKKKRKGLLSSKKLLNISFFHSGEGILLPPDGGEGEAPSFHLAPFGRL